MRTIPLSEAKARLSEIADEIADEVGRTHERVHITRNGREYVVLLAAEDLESIEATLELLADTQAQERIAADEAGNLAQHTGTNRVSSRSSSFFADRWNSTA